MYNTTWETKKIGILTQIANGKLPEICIRNWCTMLYCYISIFFGIASSHLHIAYCMFWEVRTPRVISPKTGRTYCMIDSSQVLYIAWSFHLSHTSDDVPQHLQFVECPARLADLLMRDWMTQWWFRHSVSWEQETLLIDLICVNHFLGVLRDDIMNLRVIYCSNVGFRSRLSLGFRSRRPSTFWILWTPLLEASNLVSHKAILTCEAAFL